MPDDPMSHAIGDIGERLDYPMYIVTCANGDHRSGCLVGFATQASVSPARFIVFISKNNHTFRVAQTAAALGIHVVPRDQEPLARLFGEKTGDDIDKFSETGWTSGADGVPLLEACPDRFVGRVLDRLDAGDHMGFLVEPHDVDARGTGFFGFQQAKGFDPGHEA
jgi:flavin reductase (DIM6/NTAB) family NADH-FMN oxidoreductase RutF